MKKTRIPWYYRNPKDGTEMVLIPGGWFWMGCNKEEDPEALDRESPRHLHFVKPFYLSITCVTVAQFKRFVEETGYRGGDYPGTGDGYSERWGYWKKDPDDHPVRYVNWFDAKAYCEWAGLRLPTEAEWELAARGYQALKYPWGNGWEDGQRVCWTEQKGPGGETAPVFYHPEGVSPLGTFQQSGNVCEWCENWYDGKVYERYSRGDFTSPDTGEYCVLRGASWYDGIPKSFRGGSRYYRSRPGYRLSYRGFRSANTITL